MTSSAAVEHTYTAEFATGVRAEMTLSLAGVSCAWTPDFPRHLSGQRRRRFLQSYRAWRADCVADFARRTGVAVTVVEL